MTPAERRAARARQRGRTRVTRVVAEADSDIRAMLDQMADAIAAGMTPDMGANEVEQLLEEEYESLGLRVTPRVRTAIQDAAREAYDQNVEEFEAVFGPYVDIALEDRQLVQGDGRGIWGSAARRDAVTALVAIQVGLGVRPGQLGYERRLQLRLREAHRVAAAQLVLDARHARRVLGVLDRLERARTPAQRERVLTGNRVSINRFGGHRGPLARVIGRILRGRATPDEARRVLGTQRGSRAREISRSAAQGRIRNTGIGDPIDAWHAINRANSPGHPGLVGYRWELSPAHPAADICDELAENDADGLGPGGYLPENVPWVPHSRCLCSISPIFDVDVFERIRSQSTGAPEPSRPWESEPEYPEPGDWLASLSEQRRAEVLGPTRARAWHDNPDLRSEFIVDHRVSTLGELGL